MRNKSLLIILALLLLLFLFVVPSCSKASGTPSSPSPSLQSIDTRLQKIEKLLTSENTKQVYGFADIQADITNIRSEMVTIKKQLERIEAKIK